MTIHISLYAGPGAGKSTTAAAVFAALKRRGVNCELIQEYAKSKCWEQASATRIFNDQIYLFGKQFHEHHVLDGQVDVTITDAPLLLGVVYNRIYAKLQNFDALALEAYNRFDNLNYYLVRSKAYNPIGRNQTEEEAMQVDQLTRGMLDGFEIPYKEVNYTTAEDVIVDEVLMKLAGLGRWSN